MGDGEAFICESCVESDAEKARTYSSPLLRLAPRHDDPNRSVMIYIGTCNVLSWRLPDGEWTEIAAPGNPLIDKLIEALGGHDNLVPTARLVAEVERQAAARAGLRPMGLASAAVLRDREAWLKQPINQALLDHMSVDSREHNQRTKVKYAALYAERPDLFE